MKRCRIAWVMLALSLVLGSSLLVRVGAFSSNTVLVHVIATTGADYGVSLGGWKLNGPASDTVEWFSTNEVFVVGTPNPWPIDYDTMFDYFVIEGQVVGLDQVGDSGGWYPVIGA